MMPIVARASEVVLRIVPGTLREASYALGASQWRTVWNVVLPTARSGLATAVVLAMARGIGETAPVLLVAGYTKELNPNPFSGPQTSLPLFIYNAPILATTAAYVDAASGPASCWSSWCWRSSRSPGGSAARPRGADQAAAAAAGPAGSADMRARGARRPGPPWPATPRIGRTR